MAGQLPSSVKERLRDQGVSETDIAKYGREAFVPLKPGTRVKEIIPPAASWLWGTAPVPAWQERHVAMDDDIHVTAEKGSKVQVIAENPAFTHSLGSNFESSAKDLSGPLAIIVGGWLAWKFLVSPVLAQVAPGSSPAITNNLGAAASATPTAQQIAVAQQVSTLQGIEAAHSAEASAAQVATAQAQLAQAQALYQQGLLTLGQFQAYQEQFRRLNEHVNNIQNAITSTLNFQGPL